MRRCRFLLLLPVIVVVGLASCSSPVPPAGLRDQIVGSWELRERTVRRQTGEVVVDAVLGPQPVGRLFYGASGHVALQMMRQGRAQAITSPAAPEDAGNARVILGYDAYFGTFAIDEAAGTITHHIESSLFPEDLGKDFVRRFRIEGDRFELSFTSRAADGSDVTRTLVFARSR